MKVQVSNTNAPCWRDITVKSRVPAQLDILQAVSYTHLTLPTIDDV